MKIKVNLIIKKFNYMFVILFGLIIYFPIYGTQILTVCTAANDNPIIYLDQAGSVQGFEPELIERFSKMNRFSVTYKIMEVNSLIPALLTHKCDIAASAFLMTQSRKQQIDFSLAIFNNRVYVISLSKSSLCLTARSKSFNIFDDPHLQVGVTQGSAVDDYLKRNPTAFSMAKAILFTNESDVILALRIRKIGAMINGSHTLHFLEEKFPKEFCGIQLEDGLGLELALPVGMGFTKKSPYLLLFNRFLENFFKTQDYKNLLKQFNI